MQMRKLEPVYRDELYKRMRRLYLIASNLSLSTQVQQLAGHGYFRLRAKAYNFDRLKLHDISVSEQDTLD